MKNYLIFLFFLFSTKLFATDYYVSNSGSDSNAGTDTITPWATLSKVQAEMDAGTFNSGDQILFNRGDKWRGSLEITVSGLTIGAYGSGDKPIFDGTKELVQSFSRSGNIWRITDIDLPSNEDYLAGILINDIWYRLGRYPDDGYLYFESASGNNLITDNESNFPAGYWNDGECVTRTMNYIMEKLDIDSYNGGTFSLSENAYTNFLGSSNSYCNGYFIQNHDNTLSKDGEWNYDAGSRTLKVFYTGDLNNQIVQMPVEDIGIKINVLDCIIKDITLIGYQFKAFDIGITNEFIEVSR